MSHACGQAALGVLAPDQAPALDRLEAGAWRAMQDADRVDLLDLAARVAARQHGLPHLMRPTSLGPSPWTEVEAASWRRIDKIAPANRAALAFAEQVAFHVASIQPDQRAALFDELGAAAAPFAQAIYAVDMLPRARAALDALFGPSDWSASELDPEAELGAAIDDVIRVIPALQAVDPVTTELVRLLGARRHACRVCQSVRSYSAIEAGADDVLFDAVEEYASSDYSASQRSALAFADGMLSSPARFESDVVEGLLAHFDPAACVELVLDVTRNATNKLAVALGGDAPRVETGYEIYDVKPNGEIAYGLSAP